MEKKMKKTLQITEAYIEVSLHSNNKLYYSLKAKGILPNCRKEATLHVTPMAQYIWVNNLYRIGNDAIIKPIDWENFIKSLEVKSSKIFPVEITDKIKNRALNYCLEICYCPAVKQKNIRVENGYFEYDRLLY